MFWLWVDYAGTAFSRYADKRPVNMRHSRGGDKNLDGDPAITRDKGPTIKIRWRGRHLLIRTIGECSQLVPIYHQIGNLRSQSEQCTFG